MFGISLFQRLFWKHFSQICTVIRIYDPQLRRQFTLVIFTFCTCRLTICFSCGNEGQSLFFGQFPQESFITVTWRFLRFVSLNASICISNTDAIELLTLSKVSVLALLVSKRRCLFLKLGVRIFACECHIERQSLYTVLFLQTWFPLCTQVNCILVWRDNFYFCRTVSQDYYINIISETCL